LVLVRRLHEQKESVLAGLDWEEPRVFVTCNSEEVCEITLFQGLTPATDNTARLKYTIRLTMGYPPEEEKEHQQKWETLPGTTVRVKKGATDEDIKMAILADELNAAVEAEEKWLLISSEDFSRPSFFRSYKEIAQWNHEGGRDWSLKKMVEFREREDAKRIRKYREAKAKRQREAEKEGEDGEGKFEDHQHDTKRPRFPKNLFAFTASNKGALDAYL